MAAIQMIGVPFAGWMYDTTGDYQPAFIIFLGLYLLAAIVVLGLRVPRRKKQDYVTIPNTAE
jgi:cyanate permease